MGGEKKRGELAAFEALMVGCIAEARILSPDEEAGIEAALESYRQGRVIDAKRAREIIDASLTSL